MRIDTANQRQSKFIVGILVITVFTICFAIVLGYGDYLKDEPDNCYLSNSNCSPNAIEVCSGNNDLVTVTQRKELEDLDTEKGKIEIIKEELPAWTVVPLCIDDDLVAPYYVLVKVTGGYKPYDGWSIKLYQDRDDDKNNKEYIGTIKMVPTIVPELSGCCWTVYNITFDVVGCIKVESNHFPDIPAGWDLIKEVPCTPDLNKEVDIVISTHWYGCGEPYQRFEVILSQKNVFPDSPDSRMEIIPSSVALNKGIDKIVYQSSLRFYKKSLFFFFLL
ncbi:MAG: hypothetical protein ACFFA0_15885 [Promethearchaeota archaeon]